MKHLQLQVDLGQPGPAYRQIADSLRTLLVTGRMQPGDRLPSSRALAQDLGVHFNTVAEAYRVLAEEGWLGLQRGRGAVVTRRRSPGKASQEVIAGCLERLRRLLAEMKATGIPQSDMRAEFARVWSEEKSA